MKTKEKIKLKALELFNSKGVLNVTLRDVASGLNMSYGTITYHYNTKKKLIDTLYHDMLTELQVISKTILNDNKSLFYNILNAPRHTFQLSIKYLFFYVDYIEVRRSFPDIAREIDKNNEQRMQFWKGALKQLQQENIIRGDIEDKDLEYLMELSGAMRTFFFLKIQPKGYTATLEKQYLDYVNRLIMPYLTSKGRKLYTEISAGP